MPVTSFAFCLLRLCCCRLGAARGECHGLLIFCTKLEISWGIHDCSILALSLVGILNSCWMKTTLCLWGYVFSSRVSLSPQSCFPLLIGLPCTWPSWGECLPWCNLYLWKQITLLIEGQRAKWELKCHKSSQMIEISWKSTVSWASSSLLAG